MKRAAVTLWLSFESRLESISSQANYFALSVPAKITKALGTLTAVPILARINASLPFRGSLFPVGGGRHYMRVKAEVRKAAQVKGGDRVRVRISVVDRSTEISIPKDLRIALRADGVEADFKALPPGKRSYLLRWIEKAAKLQTREKRIQEAVEAAHAKREKLADSSLTKR